MHVGLVWIYISNYQFDGKQTNNQPKFPTLVLNRGTRVLIFRNSRSGNGWSSFVIQCNYVYPNMWMFNEMASFCTNKGRRKINHSRHVYVRYMGESLPST